MLLPENSTSAYCIFFTDNLTVASAIYKGTSSKFFEPQAVGACDSGATSRDETFNHFARCSRVREANDCGGSGRYLQRFVK